ncbi:Transposon TX1 uncharacterized 149 kDa protein [Linum grandiflorum]
MVGYPFTWIRSKGTPRCIEERLDRCFLNESWSERYEDAVLRNLIPPVSDHSPIILSTEGFEPHFSPCQFRFENAWLAEPSLRPMIQDCWNSTKGQPLLPHLTDCATNLNRWGKDLALRFRRDIHLTKQQMEYYREGTDDSTFAAFTASREKLLLLLQQEETFWRQRAKHFWLSEGDLNTKYFHGVANGRTKRKHIDRLKADNGTWQETNEALAATAKAYFAALFTAQGSHVELVVSSLESRISAEDNAQLTSPFTKDEFCLALFDMNPNKSPGPDGFNPGFYQKFFGICLAMISIQRALHGWLRE